MTTDAVIAAVRDDLYAAEYQEWSAMLESSLPPRESQEPDPACCTACGLTIFGVDRECGLCAECRHDLAEAAAWLAMTTDDADGYGPDGLTDGERGYREATDEATREQLAAVCRNCNDYGQCSECHGTSGYPAASCPACSGTGDCPFCHHTGD